LVLVLLLLEYYYYAKMSVRKQMRGQGGIEQGGTPSQQGRTAPERARLTWLTLQQKTHEQ